MVIPRLLTRFCMALFVVAAMSGAASSQERTACNEDYEKFCKGLMPGGGRVLNCLLKNTGQLKSQCKDLLSKLSSPGAKGVSMTLMPSEKNEKPDPVPGEFRRMYETLEDALADFDGRIGPAAKGTGRPLTFGAGLPAADCNRGRELLNPDALADVIEYLDELKELGVEAVTVPIGYPVYAPFFPDYARYVAFYKQVAQEVKKRDMKLCVEAHVAFVNTGYSDIRMSFTALTFERYKAEKKAMVSAIIRDLDPDYLNIGSEPDTEAAVTGVTELNDPLRYAEYIRYVLTGLHRGKARITAGIGSWGNLAYATSLARFTSIDALSVHIYPVTGRSPENALAVADIARQYGKGLVIDKAWLAKSEQYVGRGNETWTEVLRRDNFSFWAPLDRKFLSILVKLARAKGAEYISPFRSGYFFAYVNYDEKSADLRYRDIQTLQERAALASAMEGKVTPTGRHYWVLIESGLR